MHEEMKSLHKNNTYELMELPKGKRALKNKWVLKKKPEPNRLQPRRGNIYGTTRRVYNQRQGTLSVSIKEKLVWSQADTEIVKFSDGEFIIFLLYVDDMLIVGRDTGKIDKLKKELSKSFEMKDLGFLSNPGKKHRATMKWILKYLRGTSKTCLYFRTNKPVLVGCTYAHMARDVDSKKSTSCYLIIFSRGTMSWQSRLQKYVTLSTIEAEYIVITEASKELL
ncbi:Retrovirus-related Pol polyprotein from transposon TNT 1-94 [Vitis vinifera]|uniref:Retrovirus-related Pol polyprotein from transposon TNT 1-94 n=1 Tax=Vitis vinifera TaxID=29760 RepID=A0A438FRA0_VITVI|nr:Retrovirus-related Pol polyprotein from transposon TNT 1-94 [Vitis vinifera]